MSEVVVPEEAVKDHTEKVQEHRKRIERLTFTVGEVAQVLGIGTSKMSQLTKSKDKQDNIKDIGGFVGGKLKGKNRTYYPIDEAIEEFLSDVYIKCDMPNRYTYAEGSSSAGLVIYDDVFAYSNHDTDPCSKKLCNAFDLVRIHKFGELDKDMQITSMNSSQPQILSLLGANDIEALRTQASSVWNANYCKDGAVTSVLAKHYIAGLMNRLEEC